MNILVFMFDLFPINSDEKSLHRAAMLGFFVLFLQKISAIKSQHSHLKGVYRLENNPKPFLYIFESKRSKNIANIFLVLL